MSIHCRSAGPSSPIEQVDSSVFDHKEIPGWFNFQEIYDLIVERARNNPKPLPIVEVGCWLGRSTIYLASLLKFYGLKNPLYAVDTWQGTPSEPAQQEYLEELKKTSRRSLFQNFMDNLIRYEVEDYVFPIVQSSQRVAQLFQDDSVLAVFIDGDHSYQSVCNDLVGWYKPIIKGGILAGHDYYWGEVRLALEQVKSRFDYRVIGKSYLFDL